MIVLCAGGTGGHVFPAEALASALKKRGKKIGLITDSRAMHFVNYEYFDAIFVAHVDRSNILIYIFSLLKNIFKSVWFLVKNHASIVVGFGGYPSLPGMLAAQLLFKRTFLHEQNAILGKANRFLLPLAKGLAISFKETKRAPKNAKWIGNPIRELVVHTAISNEIHKDKNYFYLTIVGGSQGAQLFSNIVPKAISLLPKNLQNRLNIVQQCRPEDLENVRNFYKNLNVTFYLESFFLDLPTHLKKSDLVICRAGASTVAELSYLGVPAIFVPLAISKENDQGENAKSMEKQGGALTIIERNLTPEMLVKHLKELMENTKILKKMSYSMVHLAKPNAAEDLANWIEELS